MNSAFGKFLENVRNLLRLELFKKDDIKKFIKLQSKLTFNGFHKSYENCDNYRTKQNELVMDKAIIVGFAILELSKLHMYETYHEKLQAYLGQENFQLHYVNTDGMILSMKTQNTINDIKILEDILGFSNHDQKHELFSKRKNSYW